MTCEKGRSCVPVSVRVDATADNIGGESRTHNMSAHPLETFLMGHADNGCNRL